MKIFIYLLIVLVIYLVFSYLHFRSVLSKSTNPEIIQTEMEFGSGSLVRYLAAGDSTAQGSGASTVTTTYPHLVANFLATDKKVLYKNIGVSGARIADVIQHQLPQIIAYQPDIVTISVGGNDIDRLAAKDEVVSGYMTIIKELTEKTSATIYLANLPNFTGAKLLPLPYVWLIEKRSAPINTAISALETERVKIVNVHDFKNANITEVSSTYSSDWFHPNDEGYRNWAREFILKMR